MTKLRLLFGNLRSNFWLVPLLMVAAGVALALVLVEVDVAYPGHFSARVPMLFGAGASGARGLLSSIATSMITIAGVTFSITVVALSLASSQYSPRILRNFVRDRANQSVLGVFVGVFAYCLVVLRTIRADQGGASGFVPELAVFGAVLLAFAAIGFLIFFIHHVAVSIQATHIIMGAAKETLGAIDRMFPDELGSEPEDASHATLPELPTEWSPLPSRKSGYLRAIDEDELVEIAKRRGIVIRMHRAVGEFIAEGATLASVSRGDGGDDVADAVCSSVAIGRDRTLDQDPEFGIRQIVDIALKALSPGINDSTTALICLDLLYAIVARVQRRRMPDAFRRAAGRLCVITCEPTFEGLASDAFDQIRQNAGGNVRVLSKLTAVLDSLAAEVENPERRRVLEEQLHVVLDDAERTVPSAHDRAWMRGRRRSATQSSPHAAAP